MVNYYQIFGVAPQASLQEIKTAYKKLALQYHPDRNPQDPQAEENFKLINEIYQTLSDEYKRMAYDYLLLYQSQQNTHSSPPTTAQNYTSYQPPTPPTPTDSSPTISTKVKFRILLMTFLGLLLVVLLGVVLFKYAKINNAQNMLQTAQQYIKEDKPLEALKLLDVLISENPTQMDAVLLRATLSVDLNNYWQALQDVNLLLSDARFASAEVYFLKGKSLFFLYNSEEAIKNIEQAIGLKKTETKYYAWLAIIQKKQNLDKSIICENWQKAQGEHKNFYFEEMQEFCQ